MTTSHHSHFRRLYVLILVFLLAAVTISPNMAFAIVQLSDGSGGAEGDPGDGNGFAGGGGVLDDPDISPVESYEIPEFPSNVRVINVGRTAPIFNDGYFCFILVGPTNLVGKLNRGQR
jgi:hypothetical protein